MRLPGWLLGVRVIALALPATLSARAVADEACHFTWPLETEIGWFQAPKVEEIPTGTQLPEIQDEALALAIVPLSDAKLTVAPSRTRDGDGPNAGAVAFANVPAGIYQVTIERDAWIDAVQDGGALKAVDHTGSRTCPRARKSVRFEAKAGLLIVEVSAATGATIKLAVRRVQ